jgi:hypothetical protein
MQQASVQLNQMRGMMPPTLPGPPSGGGGGASSYSGQPLSAMRGY